MTKTDCLKCFLNSDNSKNLSGGDSAEASTGKMSSDYGAAKGPAQLGLSNAHYRHIPANVHEISMFSVWSKLCHYYDKDLCRKFPTEDFQRTFHDHVQQTGGCRTDFRA